MPWKIDNNGEQVYIASKYAKEELPTWAEIYEDFWLNENFAYSEKEGNDKDLYWNIPYKKFILAISCNQLNKMIYEDKFDLSKLNSLFTNRIINAKFSFIDHEIKEDAFPEIYTIPMPNGEENPFILNDNKRINISEIDPISLKIILQFDDNHQSVYNQNNPTFKNILEIFMEQYIDYFKEPVGWKK